MHYTLQLRLSSLSLPYAATSPRIVAREAENCNSPRPGDGTNCLLHPIEKFRPLLRNGKRAGKA